MEPLFALDIGTRMVMGLLIVRKDHQYEILASARTEHRQRAMYDGQIHDVEEVFRAVVQIKKALEEQTGLELKSVAVAAAGRALTTQLATIEREEKVPVAWDREAVLALELEAVQQALKTNLSLTDDASLTYHCVGYNVVQYWLEGERIGNLAGQRGRKVALTVIATFLPRTVVDGLVAVLDKAKLTMHSLTLEPIAAGLVAIPENMRRLNLALVDIGAGTADIALTRDGNFFAYGMVPVAGDEVTEAICSRYLLDFHTGEQVKRKISGKKPIVFKDFFGVKIKIDRQTLLDEIKPVVQNMAEKITQEILQLNGEIPQAVILIGGGSLTPLIPEMIAQTIGIPGSRIGLQIRERIEEIIGDESVKGPDSITPIGIGVASLEQKALHYYSVSVNGVPAPIFELQLATAAEALVAVGIQPRAFFGRPGLALTYELNGAMRIVKGKLGKPAQLLINGQIGRLEQTVFSGDELRFTPGVPGEDAEIFVKDVNKEPNVKKIYWNSAREDFKSLIYINEALAAAEDRIADGAKVTLLDNEDLAALLQRKGVALNQPGKIEFKLNGTPRAQTVEREVYVNEQKTVENCPIRDGDKIALKEKTVRISDLNITVEPLEFYVNEKKILYPPSRIKILHRGKEVAAEAALQEGMELRVEGHDKNIILSQILPLIHIPEPVRAGSKLKITVNKQPADFTTPIHPGDRMTIRWE